MDNRNNCDTTNGSGALNNCDGGGMSQDAYNYASVVNELSQMSPKMMARNNHIQSPARFQQHLNSDVSASNNRHQSIISPQLARLTRTLRHGGGGINGSAIYGGSTSSAYTASPCKTLLSSLSSASCSPRSDMNRYQNTASIFSNSTEMSDLNGSSLIIYQGNDDTLPLDSLIYDTGSVTSSSNQHVYCEIPPVPPPPPPARTNRIPRNEANRREEFKEAENKSFYYEQENMALNSTWDAHHHVSDIIDVGTPRADRNIPKNEFVHKRSQNNLNYTEEVFHEELRHEQAKNMFSPNTQQHQLTPYEREFLMQNKAVAHSSSGKLNGSPARRRNCQSNQVVNSFSPTKSSTKSPRHFISVENNATKCSNNDDVQPDMTRSPKKKNPLRGEKNGENKNSSSKQTKHESQV